MGKKATARHFEFAANVAAGMDAKSAAINAGFTEETAKAKAHAWVGLSRSASVYPELWDHIQKLKAPALEKQKFTVEEGVKILADIARARPLDAMETGTFGFVFKDLEEIPEELKVAIKSISFMKGKGMKVEFFDKQRSVDMLLKHLGGYEKDNAQRNPANEIDYSQLSPEELYTLYQLEKKAQIEQSE